MNKYRFLTRSLFFLTAALPVHADYFWDGNDLTGDADGGGGVWDTSTANWDTLIAGGDDTAWSDSETAVFGGTSGTVSLAEPITAAGLNFTATGYTVQDGTLALGGGAISAAPGVEATVSSIITGGAGLEKTGAGTLTLAGGNTFAGATRVSEGVLKLSPAVTAYRYYRFTVSMNFGNGTTTQDGYNQIGELHYYKDGVWEVADNGSATFTGAAPGAEQSWTNANDNRGANVAGFTKYGVGTRPYSITYDFTDPIVLDSYNWSTGNDSTPARNPRKWVVSGSNDNVNFKVLDDRSLGVQTGPTSTYTWSGATGAFATNVNAIDGGAADAYPLSPSALPSGSALQIASGASLDLNGARHIASSLEDLAGGGGTVLNSAAGLPATLVIGSAASTVFSGTIGDNGSANALNLAKVGSGTQTLSGSASNTYSGDTILGGTGRLLLAKTGGAIAIPGDIFLSSTAFAANTSGLVLAGDEQIADSAILAWTSNSYGSTTTQNQADSFFRLNGHTETIGGLSTVNTAGFPVVENRGFGDTTAYGTGTLIMDVAASETYTYNGQIRNTDGGSNGGTIALTKKGDGTQILGGSMGGCTGPALIEAGVLRVNSSLASATVTVTGTGKLEGTGTMSGAVTVQSGGVFAPGVAGAGAFNCGSPVLVASGGTLSLPGSTLNGTATIAAGGVITGGGAISGALTVQPGGEFAPGTAGIGNLTTASLLSLGGNATFEIDKTGGSLTSDSVSGFSNVTFGGTLTIVATGDSPQLGDSFQLFVPAPGGTFGGSFDSIVGLPALTAGLQWETTSLLTEGTITVVDHASTPAFNPAGGGYVGAQSVTITSDSGSTIYYTLDGSEPTTSSSSGISPVSGIEIPVDSVVTLKAFAATAGFTDSPVTTAEYRTVTIPQWGVDANGNWSTATNWVNEVIPNGSGIAADFTTAQSAARTVTLDSNRTVGSLVFGNTGGFPWTLARTGTSVLTLNVPSGTPGIGVQDVDTTISAVLAGSQGIEKTGAGTLFLTGTNTYVGNTAVNGGVLSVPSLALSGNPSPLGSGTTISLDGGTLRYTGAGSIGFPTFNRVVTLGEGGGTIDTATGGFWFTAGSFSGPGSLTKIGARQLIIQSNNTFDGDTFVNEAEIQIRTLDGLGSTVGKTIVANGARVAAGGALVGTVAEDFDLNGFGGGNGALQANDGGTAVTFSGDIVLASDSGIGGSQAFTLSGSISGNGGLVKFSGNAVTISGTGPSTYLGTTVLGGTGKLVLAKPDGVLAIPGDISLSSTAFNGNNSGVVLAANEQIADGAILTWTSVNQAGGAQSPSYLRLNGFTETVGGLSAGGSPGSPAIENRGLNDAAAYGTGTLVINTTGSNSYTYNGAVRDMDGGIGGGAIAITKTGTGTQIFTGGLTYTGATLVSAGTLGLDAVANSPVTVTAGATLTGTGGTSATLGVEDGAILAPGADLAGAFAAGDTVLAGTFACDIDAATADRLTVTGNLDVTGADLDFTVLAAPTEISYVIASYTGELTGEFTVTGLPAEYSVVYDAVAMEVRLEKQVFSFAAYASLNGLSGDPADDFDKDGVPDAVEYVLGTAPDTATQGPDFSVEGGNLVFTFNREHDSITPDISVAVQVGTGLNAWPDVYNVGADTASSDAGIVVTDNGTNDTITLTVPQAPDDRKFARLVVTVTP